MNHEFSFTDELRNLGFQSSVGVSKSWEHILMHESATWGPTDLQQAQVAWHNAHLQNVYLSPTSHMSHTSI